MESLRSMKRKGGSLRGKQAMEATLSEQELRERIALKAYELYEKRGRTSGCDVDDWLEAEKLVAAEITDERHRKPQLSRKGSNRSTQRKSIGE